MDIWSLIFCCSAIYLIWFYQQSTRQSKILKKEQERIRLNRMAAIKKQDSLRCRSPKE